MLQTLRLDLVPAPYEALIAEYRGREALGQVLGVHVPLSWPPEFFDEAAVTAAIERLRTHPGEADWWTHYVIERRKKALIGACGFKGPPNAEGTVHIAYSILPEFRRQGYATEVVLGMLEQAFDVALVKRVVARSLPDLHAGRGVLRKCGFEPEEVEGQLERFVVSRERRRALPPARKGCD